MMGKKTIDTIEDKLGNLFDSVFEEGVPARKKGAKVTERNTENAISMFHDIVEGQSGNQVTQK